MAAATWCLFGLVSLACVTATTHGTDRHAGYAAESDAAEAPILSRVRRVIGGRRFAAGKWPWLVSIQGKIPVRTLFGVPIQRHLFYCGASLLNDRWLLTAAHCFPTPQYGNLATTPRYWHARLGERELDVSILDKLRGLIAKMLHVRSERDWYIHAERIVIHPDYNRAERWTNDIALVKLREDVPAEERVLPEIQPVALPTPAAAAAGFPADDAVCVMKGWGCTARGGSVSHVAQEVLLPKVSDAECERFWETGMSRRLCAGYNLEHMGICPGDSGGPLVCQLGGKWVQAGVASFTSSTRPGNVPGVFTRVSPYTAWIRDTIASD